MKSILLLLILASCEKPAPCATVISITDSAVIARYPDSTLQYFNTHNQYNIGDKICK
jgi:hypothetical protein